MTDLELFNQNIGVWWSQCRSSWNILPGTEAFNAEWVSSEAEISFQGPNSESLKILPVLHPCQGCGAGVRAEALHPGLKTEPPRHLTAGAPSQQMLSRIPESESEPGLPKILDLVTVRTCKIKLRSD